MLPIKTKTKKKTSVKFHSCSRPLGYASDLLGLCPILAFRAYARERLGSPDLGASIMVLGYICPCVHLTSI